MGVEPMDKEGQLYKKKNNRNRPYGVTKENNTKLANATTQHWVLFIFKLQKETHSNFKIKVTKEGKKTLNSNY